MALIMTAICSDGISQISGVEMALRGYNDLPTKLSRLGIDCKWSE
jgi:UDP-N-acetylglucosamine 1-carboxyvinyltransferase